MDIVSSFNPPRLVRLGGESFWVRALTYADISLIVGWLDDVVPGRSERKMPPRFDSEESRVALDSVQGHCVLSWVALRHVGVTYERAVELTLRALDPENTEGPYELARLNAVLFSRRRTRPESPDVVQGRDVGQSWYGPMVESFVRNFNITVEQVGELTMDQVTMLTTAGLEHEDPEQIQVKADLARFHEMAKANAARKAMSGADGGSQN